jgi:transcription initiation factor TFIIIB Brf1 subunit/transcription initiation factor TFIIB
LSYHLADNHNIIHLHICIAMTDISSQDGISLDISKMLLEISNEKRRQKKEFRNINTNYETLTDALVNFKCTDCNSINIKEIDGYYTCLKCGLKIENVIDAGQEWRYYSNDDNKGADPARCDMPTNELLPKSSMGSIVGFSSRETFTAKRIRNMNHWYSNTYKECSLMETFNNITIMAITSGINQCVIEEAKYMYKKVSDIKSSRRTKKEGMKAGAIALACKLKGVPRNTPEIAKICHMKNNKTLRKSIKTFEEIWNNIILKENHGIVADTGHDIIDDSATETDDEDDVLDALDVLDVQEVVNNKNTIINTTTNTTPTTTTNIISKSEITSKITSKIVSKSDSDSESDSDDEPNYMAYNGKLHRFISDLGLDEKVYTACKVILEYVEKNNYLDKHNPLSRITSIIFYIVDRFNIKINKYQIIQTCAVSEVTINKCYQKLMKFKTELNKIILPL